MSINNIVATIRSRADFQASEYSLKCYAAGMLAYYIALRIGLQNPYWAVTTCYLTASPQPLAGAIISKAIYRTFGTLLGVAAAVVLVPCFVRSPLALSIVLALWLGICTYIGALDRTPRSYVFYLAGYTASIIGFPSVETPGNIFNLALLREQEIVLGILCTSFVHGAIFPRTLTKELQRRLDTILADAAECSAQSLEARGDPSLGAARRSLVAQLNDLSGIAVQLPFDTARLLPGVRPLNALLDELTLLLPVEYALEDRLVELARLPDGVPDDIRVVTVRIADWLRNGIHRRDIAPETLIAGIREGFTGPVAGSAWPWMLTLNLLGRLEDLVMAQRNARALREHLRGSTNPTASAEITGLIDRARSRSQYRDHLSAALAGARAAIVVLLGCLFWIFTAWPSGAVAVLMSAVVACLFGNSPIGPSLIRRYLWGVGIGIVVAALYGYAILPRITDPVLYASVLAPPLLLFGGLLSRPERALQANALLVGFINTVGLAATYRGDFAIFANTALGLAMGIGFSALVISWTLIDSANLAAMGLLRSAYRDVARRADQEEGDSAAWITRMLDRIALLYTRLQSKETDPTTPVMAALTDMRTGLLAGSLRELRGQTSDAENGTLDRILRGIQCHYRELNPRAPSLPADPLLREIDRGLHAFLDQNSLRARRGLELLTGLRRNLFPSAAPPTATAL